MNLIDFEYAGKSLSSMGMIVCDFSNSSGDTVNVGNELSMTQQSPSRSDLSYLVDSSYDGPLQMDFSICKNPCTTDSDLSFTDDEVNEIMRWLNRKSFAKLVPVYDDSSFQDVYFMATFNVTVERGLGGVIGFNLEMNTNAPYGFREQITLNSTDNSLSFEDLSDEVGHIYPDFSVTVNAVGDLQISNPIDPLNVVQVKNCHVDETITFHGRMKQITSDRDSHTKLAEDFNWKFPRVVNTYTSRTNTFTSNIDCSMTIKYSPVRKVGIV